MIYIIGLGNPGKKYANTRHNTGFLMLEALKKQLSIINYQLSNKSKAPNFKLQKKLAVEICKLDYLDEKIILIKPQTFMNKSGEAVKYAVEKHRLSALTPGDSIRATPGFLANKPLVFTSGESILPAAGCRPRGAQPTGRSGRFANKNNKTIEQFNNLFVVHDDLDLVLGEYKIQFGKGPRKHNGLLSIERELKSQDFWRVRIGARGEYYERIKLDGDKNIADDYLLKPFGKEEKKALDQVLIEAGRELLERVGN